MVLGVRAHDFGKLPVEELAERISGKGFRCVQLAPSKAIEGLEAKREGLNAEMAGRIRKAFDEKGIHIAVLGCYINPVHPEPAERRAQLSRFKEHLRYARDFGCKVVATETGSLNADFSFNPENHGERAFELLSDSLGELVGEAEKHGVAVGIEGVSHYVLNNPRRVARLLDKIGSGNLQVVFDPVNFITGENYLSQDGIIKEAFELFGDRMAAFHAKDFTVDNGKINSVQAGRGSLNYPLAFRLLKAHRPHMDILMEDTQPDVVEEGIAYLRSVYAGA